jgi:hypothetical protein
MRHEIDWAVGYQDQALSDGCSSASRESQRAFTGVNSDCMIWPVQETEIRIDGILVCKVVLQLKFILFADY